MQKFSIILPVKNGGQYVRKCVDSILSQTVSDFNLIVLDNRSEDETVGWIASLQDNRIEIYPSDKPLSIEENWSRALHVQKNQFMTLIGHDDILEPDYLEIMDRLIQKHPQASLYQTHFRYIDAHGERIRNCKPMDEIQNAQEFLGFFLANSIDVMGTGFMMRSKDYEDIGGIPARYPNLLFADFELYINLTLKSYKATAWQDCFAFRLHQSATTTSPDIKFHKSYELFIDYLDSLRKDSPVMGAVISRYALQFIETYSKGLAHRLLRTPSKKRENLTVETFLKRSKTFADRLVPDNNFNPENMRSVRVARQIDSNPVLRKSFLLFKSIYSKPLYK